MSVSKSDITSSILVYKSYGGIGDIFFTIPSLYMLKQKFDKVTYATQPRLVKLFTTHLNGIIVIDENLVDESNYTEIIELGNYPRFNNTAEKKPQIKYHTHKRVKQHSIEHYKDGIVSVFSEIEKSKKPYPFFKQRKASNLYYTIHPGAGFILKAWPIAYYAKLIELIYDAFPEYTAKIIIGPDDPNPEAYFVNDNLNVELITGDIDAVAHEVSGAQFHIGNDAGITHLAGAFNIPILTIYGPTGPGSWGAFSKKVELIWGKKGNCGLKCNYDVIINCEDRVCLNSVKPEKMFFQLLKLLHKIYNSPSDLYCLNPDFEIIIEDDSYIFASKANEYLLEIKDFESRKFLANNLTEKDISVAHMPLQFNETFQSLIKLQVFAPFPRLEFNNTTKIDA
ncbi:glycosyltransferase family 9 protein [Psychroserpens damuponensis]|uniref:glycosyltransferase family 9 protein n=1 Tax=Psychroserpens damuponensis TaxID=943936 RepID=UPI00058D7787|nr:glycosyltransferase family 9 protein [Psychroserpens damuponensis]